MKSSAGCLQFKKAPRKVCCNCRQIAEEWEGHVGLWKQTTTISAEINTERIFILQTICSEIMPIAFMLRQTYLPTKGILGLVGELWKRSVSEGWRRTESKSHVNSWRTHCKTSSWGECPLVWGAPVSSNQSWERGRQEHCPFSVNESLSFEESSISKKALCKRWREAGQIFWGFQVEV